MNSSACVRIENLTLLALMAWLCCCEAWSWPFKSDMVIAHGEIVSVADLQCPDGLVRINIAEEGRRFCCLCSFNCCCKLLGSMYYNRTITVIITDERRFLLLSLEVLGSLLWMKYQFDSACYSIARPLLQRRKQASCRNICSEPSSLAPGSCTSCETSR